jgi:FkbM family methyltransferase
MLICINCGEIKMTGATKLNNAEQDLSDLLAEVACGYFDHSPSGSQYALWAERAANCVESLFRAGGENVHPVQTGPIGPVLFPYYSMGSISSLELFGLDELILFCFYWENRGRYSRAVDIGANLGLHSLIMARCGMSVESYEPDPVHAEIFRSNMKLNSTENEVVLHEAAVSSEAGEQEFVRVLGNTTGSHLKGAKADPYGKLEYFKVNVQSISDVLAGANLMKLDAEGEEGRILLATNPDDWCELDAVVEVGNSENAEAIFDHFSETPINLFAQQTGWGRILGPEQMPRNYREGSLFISKLEYMPWGGKL